MNDGLKDKHRKAILEVLEKHPKIERVVLFGSRAMGTFTPTSDIDIALYGNLSMQDQARIAEELDELPIPYVVDLVRMKAVTSPELLAHVKEHGKGWTPHEPNGWEETTIGEIATLQRGFDIAKTEQTNGTVPVISSGGIGSYHNEAKHDGPGVLLGRKGTLGSVYWTEIPHWPHSTTLWVKDFHGNDPKFVYYFFKAMGPELLRMDVGAANPTLNRNHVHPLPALRPPLAEQKAIASVLGALDDKIELNRRMNATLEAMARALFQSWFVDFDPVRAKLDGRQPEGMDAETAALFPDSFQDSSVGSIPHGWAVATIEEATSLIIDYRGRTPKKMGSDWSSTGIPAVSAKNVKRGRLVRPDMFKFVSEELYEKWMKDKLALGDVLMTSEAPLGELYFLALDARFCLSQRIYAMRANPEFCDPAFLYYWLDSPACQTEMINRGTGTTVVGIRQSELRKVSVVLPPLEIQIAAAKSLSAWTEQIHRNEEQSRTLATLRDTLLPKLLSGELSIPN